MLHLTKARSLPSLEYCDDAGTKTDSRANSVVELTDGDSGWSSTRRPAGVCQITLGICAAEPAPDPQTGPDRSPDPCSTARSPPCVNDP
jgi:hypothetical protein